MTSHTRVELQVDLSEATGVTKPAKIAATVHLPATSDLAGRPPVLVCMAGAGYNRRYFDLDEPGYSEAAHHVAGGTIVVAIDHLSTGDSTIPAPEDATLRNVAVANSAAVVQILSKLKDGSITEGIRVSPGAVIGAGQSMGGFITVAMQAKQRAFDGIAVLGASMVCTRLPSPLAGRELRFAGDANHIEAGAKVFSETDWRFAFHWEDVPKHLVDLDLACKPPVFGEVAPWGSAATPNISDLILPGVIAREAAAIDVPVLIAMGERDVCQDPLREIAAFQSTRDLSLIIVPRMAHMHNFAGTRHKLWRRIDVFVAQVAAQINES